jgi:hypothetical protein
MDVRLLYILGAFAKLQKATVSFFMSVCPSAWKNLAITGRIFVKSDISVFFENPSRDFNFDQNPTRISVIYVKTYAHL